MRIFTNLHRRCLSPSAPCSINVPAIFILGKKTFYWRLSHIWSEWRCHNSAESFRVMSYWFGDGSMHSCTSITQEDSHMTEIIHFYGPVKAGDHNIHDHHKNNSEKWILPVFPPLYFFHFCVVLLSWGIQWQSTGICQCCHSFPQIS